MKKEKTIYELQAEICKVLSSPKRIEIINVLKQGEKSVTDLVESLGIPKANVSQHLAVMRMKGILRRRRSGTNIYYSIGNHKVIEACSLMREVLISFLQEKNVLADTD